MDIEGRRIWQQAAGDTDHDYADLCLKWDVILIGPGDCGPWPECERYLREDGWSEKKISDLRRFCEEMKDGDLVILRRGTSVILAVGEIVGIYEHHEEFNDVDGWNISHVRRVRWLWKNTKEPKNFDTYTLKWGHTTQRLDAPDVNSWLKSLDVPDNVCDQTPVELPHIGDNANVSVDDISEYLFDKGVASGSISNLLGEIGEFVRISNWYKRKAEPPSEHETVTYLVVPLLRALGWTPQRMAIEWNRIDVALFSNLPRKKEHLSVLVEAKKIRAASLSALSQAERYAEEYENCDRIILTDGLRYGIFFREKKGSGKKEKFSLRSYMNLTDLRDRYPIYNKCSGAKDALLAMGPEYDNPS